MSKNRREYMNNNKKLIGNVIGGSIFAIILTIIGCGYYYIKNTIKYFTNIISLISKFNIISISSF